MAEAQQLVEQADGLLREVLMPACMPDAKAAARFLQEGKLDRVLALYGRAMRLDPGESAYPWNLAAAMSRLGVEDLALPFMARAVQLARRSGEAQWSGPDAELALAELAIDAGDTDLALTSLAHARALDVHGRRRTQVESLLAEIRAIGHDPEPQASLAELLNQLAA